MCYYPYVGVELDDAAFDDIAVRLGYHAPEADIRAVAANAGFKLIPLAIKRGAQLSRLLAGCTEFYTTPVGSCACNWAESDLVLAKDMVIALLNAPHVNSVTWAFYAISTDIESGESHHPVPLVELTCDELRASGLARDQATRVMRGASAG